MVLDQDGRVMGMTTGERDAMRMAKGDNIRGQTGTYVKLRRPMSQTRGDRLIGQLPAHNLGEADVTKKYQGKEQATVDSMIKRMGLDRVQMMHDNDPKAFDKAIKYKSKPGHRFSEDETMSSEMATLRSIVDNKQAEKMHGMMVDMFTASAMVQVYDKVNDENQAKMREMLKTPKGFQRMADFALSKIS